MKNTKKKGALKIALVVIVIAEAAYLIVDYCIKYNVFNMF